VSVIRLRADIDSGKTADKTPGLDPAAAPLGTDDEAAGTPVPPALAEQLRVREDRPGNEGLARQNATPSYQETVERASPAKTPGRPWWTVGAAAAVVAMIALVCWLLGYGAA